MATILSQLRPLQLAVKVDTPGQRLTAIIRMKLRRHKDALGIANVGRQKYGEVQIF